MNNYTGDNEYTVYEYLIDIDNPEEVIVRKHEVKNQLNIRTALNCFEDTNDGTLVSLNTIAQRTDSSMTMTRMSGMAYRVVKGEDGVLIGDVPDKDLID